MRLIDADVLKLAIERYLEKILSHKFLPIIKNAVREVGNDMIFAIDVQPTVDAVPVVWCKDCKFLADGKCFFTTKPKDQYDYCSLGEKVTE